MKLTVLKTLTILLILSFGLKLAAQENIVIGKKDSLFSKILSEKREFWISIPSEYNKKLEGEEFPVVLVLDGRSHFLSVVGMIERFSNSGVCPRMIVVGLNNTNRLRDFYPNMEDDKFANFLENELLPFINDKYPTKTYRLFLGHSIAGLRVVHTAIYNNQLFNGYIAIDPSLGHEQNKWYYKATHEIDSFQLNNDRLFIAMAQTMPAEMLQDTSSIEKDTTDYSNHMRRIMELSKKMEKKDNPNEKHFKWVYYPQESHNTLTQIATHDAIKFLFNWYRNDSFGEIADYNTSTEKAVQLFRDYHTRISDNLTYAVSISENSLLIQYLLYKKQIDKALALAEFNLTCHPNDPKAQKTVEKIRDLGIE